MDLVPIIAMSRRLRNTPFTSRVLRYGVKAFTVYNHMLLPTEFHSLEEDYWHLCSSVQVWDVSVERQVSISGPDATRLVQWMTPRDVSGIGPNRCVYVPLAGPTGKLINDPIALRLDENHWWLSIADSDVALWAQGLACGAGLDVTVEEPDVWPLAVQGPNAEELMMRVFGAEVADIRFFRYRKMAYRDVEFIVARSGWSKQGGFEIYVDDVDRGQQLYDELFVKGQDLSVRPGCPNLIERMESTLLSYGNDMDSRHSVLESGLGTFIDLDADVDSLSIEALRKERDRGPERRLMGLVVLAPDGPRRYSEQPFAKQLGLSFSSSLPEDISQQSVLRHCLGSQVYSPRHRVQLATATIDEPLASESSCEVLMADGELVIARICTLPFKPEHFIVDGPLIEDPEGV
ncbi:MAG: dimethylsulfoniopropionate demethylase [Granulosicoccus sp.]